MLTVTRRYTFQAQHFLPSHTGNANKNHHHCYILEVTVSGEVRPDTVGPESGMIIDFDDMDTFITTRVINRLDHESINDLIPNPTLERLTEWIVAGLSNDLDPLPGLERVRLYETSISWAEWVNA